MRTPLGRALLVVAAPILLHCAARQTTPAAPSAAGAAPAPAGVTHRSHAGGYRVWFPKAPAESADVNDGIRLHFAVAGTPSGVGLVVGWCDHYPEANAVPERVIDLELKTLLKEGDALAEQRAVSVAGLPGRAFTLRHADGRIARGRMLLRGARVYTLLAAGAEAETAAAAEPFFESFAVVGTGVPDPPAPSAARRVAFREARVTVEMHGEPSRSEIPGGKGFPAGQALAARSRGGLRAEVATFHPIRAPSARDRKQMLDGLVRGVEQKVGAVADVRDLEVQGRPAREFRVRHADLDAFYRVVALEDGPLVLQVLGPPGTLGSADAAAFFRSARLDGKR